MLAIALLLSLPLAPDAPACAPAPALAAALAPLDPVGSECRPGDRCWKDMLAGAEALLAPWPEDLHLHRLLQQLRLPLERSGDLAEGTVVSTYASWVERAPDSSVAHYLYGRALANSPGGDAAKSRSAFDRALALDPRLPWARLGLASLALWPEPKDPAAARGHLAAFMDLCPSVVDEALELAWRLPDAAFWRPQLARLRAAVQAQAMPARARHLGLLWSAELRLLGEKAARAQIRADLDALRNLPGTKDARYWEALVAAHELLGERDAASAARSELLVFRPCGAEAVKALLDEHNAAMAAAAGAGVPDDTAHALLAKLRAAEARCPDEPTFAELEVSLLGAMSTPAAADVIAAVERAFPRGPRPTSAQAAVRSAALLVRVTDRHDLALELLRLAGDNVGRTVRRGNQIMGGMAGLERTEIELVRAQALQAARRLVDAKLALDEADRHLAALRAKAGLELQAVVSSLVHRRAAVAAAQADAEGRVLDAIALYLVVPPGRERGRAEARARALWLELGGDPEALAALTEKLTAPRGAPAPASAPWEETEIALKAFPARDLSGDEVRPRLRGTTSLVMIWTIDCGPCKLEFPELVKLAKRLDPGMRVLTLAVDESAARVQAFMREQGLDVPTLVVDFGAVEAARNAFPETWIVDAEGVVRRRKLGFLPEPADAWANDTLTTMRAVAAAR